MTPDPRAALLRAALDAAARGWHVHPLWPGGKAPALHGETACPRTGDCASGHRKWEQRATTDEARIRAAWTARPYNVGIACGPSGLVVIDLDTPKPQDPKDTPYGVTAFTALCERAGQEVPTTRSVRTPSGGKHLYFTTPPGIRLPSSANTLAKKVDVRAWGGNLVAPGSTVSGAAYEVTDPEPAAPLPEWLHSLLTPRQGARALTILPAHTRAARRATAALKTESAAVATAAAGTRNTTLLASARAMGRFVAWGDIPRDVVEEAFQGAAEAAGLKPHEYRATLQSALNWSIRTCAPRPRETA